MRWLLGVFVLAACDSSTDLAPPPASSVAIDRAALAKLTPEARQVVARAPVPALVVNDDAMLAKATLLAKSDWYAVSMEADGVTVSLHATQREHRYAHIPAARPDGRVEVRGQPARVTANEAIWSVSWNEGDVAYSLDVACARLPDPRCEDERYLLSLAEKLTAVGGAER